MLNAITLIICQCTLSFINGKKTQIPNTFFISFEKKINVNFFFVRVRGPHEKFSLSTFFLSELQEGQDFLPRLPPVHFWLPNCEEGEESGEVNRLFATRTFSRNTLSFGFFLHSLHAHTHSLTHTPTHAHSHAHREQL